MSNVFMCDVCDEIYPYDELGDQTHDLDICKQCVEELFECCEEDEKEALEEAMKKPILFLVPDKQDT